MREERKWEGAEREEVGRGREGGSGQGKRGRKWAGEEGGSACASGQELQSLAPQLTTTAVISAPRLGGDRKPKQAKTDEGERQK